MAHTASNTNENELSTWKEMCVCVRARTSKSELWYACSECMCVCVSPKRRKRKLRTYRTFHRFMCLTWIMNFLIYYIYSDRVRSMQTKTTRCHYERMNFTIVAKKQSAPIALRRMKWIRCYLVYTVDIDQLSYRNNKCTLRERCSRCVCVDARFWLMENLMRRKSACNQLRASFAIH